MGRLNLPDNARIYLDTSIVIYTVMSNHDYWEILRPMWQKSQDTEISLISSELLILETFVVPLRENNIPILELYDNLFDEDIQLKPITRSILKTAAQLRWSTTDQRSSTTKLKTPDAIHAATAIECSCTMFVTNDGQRPAMGHRGFQNTPRLNVVVLDRILEG